jgi:glutathione synthase/RimK-type ligase-like ATP-grasp enzyme
MLSIEWLSDYWLCVISADGVEQRIIGGYFPINDAANAHLANDKAATSEILRRAGVTTIPHSLFRPQGRSVEACCEDVLARWSPPIVLKPNLGSGGVDVCKVATPHELCEVLTQLTGRHLALAVSPYCPIDREVRCVVLDGRLKLAFEKVRPTAGPAVDEWRHNLRLGRVPRLVDMHSEVHVVELALAACNAMQLRFATIDVVTHGTDASVLEINSSVTLDRFSSFSEAHWVLARDLYEDAIVSYFVEHQE